MATTFEDSHSSYAPEAASHYEPTLEVASDKLTIKAFDYYENGALEQLDEDVEWDFAAVTETTDVRFYLVKHRTTGAVEVLIDTVARDETETPYDFKDGDWGCLAVIGRCIMKATDTSFDTIDFVVNRIVMAPKPEGK